jgi:ATP-grasp domain-containing protein
MISDSKPLLIFCLEPFGDASDTGYLGEVRASSAVGISHVLIDFEALVDRGNPAAAVRRLPEGSWRAAFYRGWMMSPLDYRSLYDALEARGYLLVNSPEQYLHCHHFPESYELISVYTPASVWLPVDGPIDLGSVFLLLGAFGDHPVVVKDYVKSQKHHWQEACYIPSAADRAGVERVVNNFLRLQGDQLAGGLVFRQFVPFVGIGTHEQSGMPLSCEYRLVFLDGELLYSAPYWDRGLYPCDGPPAGLFLDVARKLKSRFFTMDVALAASGEWMIVEVGDGQVFRFEDETALPVFYNRLAERSSARGAGGING